MRASLPTKPDTRSPFCGGPPRRAASSESSAAATTGKADTNSSRGEELGAATGPSTRGTGSQNSPRTNAPISCHFTTISFDKYYKSTKGLGRGPLKSSKGGCRKAPIPPPSKLGKGHQGQVDPKCYLIEFTNDPYQRMRPHPPQYGAELMAQMRVELTDLLQKGAVVQVEQARGGFYSTLFLVPKKDGRQRPVINLKALNQYVQTYHFKMEGLQTLKDLIKPGDWLAKMDLKDAYFVIPIDPSHRKYLWFVVDNQTYQFDCLSFGLAAAPWVFTKTLKPVAATLHQMGVRLICYIDDILLLAETQTVAEEQVKGLQYLLECLGFCPRGK